MSDAEFSAVVVPDAVDLVTEVATMEAVFAAQRLERIHGMRREALAAADDSGFGAHGVRYGAMSDLTERSIRLELAAAMRITEHAAGRMITHAEALVCRYPQALSSLGGGRITLKHAEVLVDEIDRLPAALRGDIVERAVAVAEAEAVGTFRRAVRAMVDAALAATLEEQYRQAVQERRVVVESTGAGMGVLHLHAPEVELRAIHGRATAMAKTITGRDGEQRTLDKVRADVLCDLLIDGTTDATPATARGIRATVVVTVPALALLDDDAARASDPATVEGVGPIPISRARELCGGDTRWMRVLTHPETGAVLSVGRDSYRPPAALQRLVRWRADRCMGPGCGMPASRCEIDHQIRWADGGETSLENNAPFCKGHHLVKDNTTWRVEQLPASGGAVRWTSPTGRRYVVNPERRIPVFRPSPPVPAADRGDDDLPPF
ncbi:DUF222 domain-containing protein [Microbacterium hominis]|uniref:DUF222 domain-containing protein n=2 Tax=Microbacterium hominis TaxID=162426 RepID=A0A7D4TI64_9MICO|nr:DUF222 domain-containing protein [Microbacterium hominis]